LGARMPTVQPSFLKRNMTINVIVKKTKQYIKTGNPCRLTAKKRNFIHMIDCNGEGRIFYVSDFIFKSIGERNRKWELEL